MISNFRVVSLPPALSEYIERVFVIESLGRMPSDDLKLIVPNACAKLVIPFRNGLSGNSAEWQHVTNENKIGFIGVSDIPAIVDYAFEGPAGNITVEFSPLGVYRFFNLKYADVKNQIYDYTDLNSKIASELEERITNVTHVNQKLNIILGFLQQRLLLSETDPVFDYSVKQIIRSRGCISVKQLEKDTGYSSRWLNMKFGERLGLSPKNFASVVRFQQYYKCIVSDKEKFFFEKEFYNYYHDQSHFIREFKRFTGLPPVFLSQSNNQYDNYFYRD